MALAYVRRRLRGKQPALANYVVGLVVLQALADEAWSEVASLADDARRKHMHWVHVKTESPDHVQPDSFTREEFYMHLCRVYRDVYPDDANPTGRIALFGMVAKELHKNSSRREERDPHSHGIVYTSKQHYWTGVARRSLEAYKVKLHAACHDGYTTMYVYLRCPTPRKPLAELDPSPYFSPQHPQGGVLQRLLEVGAHADNGNRAKKRRAEGHVAEGPSRFRTGDLYKFVGETGIKTAEQFQSFAQDAASKGDSRLAEFCVVVGTALQERLDAAWAVHDAPKRLQTIAHDLPARIDKLHRAAQGACKCSGIWIPGAKKVLANNWENVEHFGHDVFQALALGAKRGVNLAIIGPPGLGKSMIFEPLDEIFEVGGRPQRDCSFPFASLMEADVLLWQEFKFSHKLCSWEDLLALLSGEKFGLRIPNAKPKQHRNLAPMFYTGRQPLRMRSDDVEEMLEYNQAMDERFKTRTWSQPLRKCERVPDFPRCGCCFAKFILQAEHDYQVEEEAMLALLA